MNPRNANARNQRTRAATTALVQVHSNSLRKISMRAMRGAARSFQLWGMRSAILIIERALRRSARRDYNGGSARPSNIAPRGRTYAMSGRAIFRRTMAPARPPGGGEAEAGGL